MSASTGFSVEGHHLSSGSIVPGRVSVLGRRIASDVSGPVWKLSTEEILIPAFHDHHTHLLGTYRPPRGPDLRDLPTRDACLQALTRWLDDHPGEEPVIGEGWDESGWDNPRPLLGTDLDRFGGGRPVALRRVCGHIAVVNRVAWEMLAPVGNEGDAATGTLRESLAMGLAQRWPAPPGKDLQGARNGLEAAHRNGVAAIDEMGRLETYRAFLRLAEEEDLALRVNHYFPLGSLRELRDLGITSGRRDGTLRAVGLKGFLDGSIGGRTAAMGCGYVDAPPGALLWETEALADLVREGARLGFSIALHAIGLRAVEQALDVFERVATAVPLRGDLRVEHAEEVDEDTIGRAARSRVALSMQPNFTARWQGEKGLYERALGERTRVGLNRFATAALNTRLLFGSDTMPFGPLAGLVGAVSHPEPRERLPLPLALRAYMPDGIGPLPSRDLFAVGEEADLAVLRGEGGNLERSVLTGTARVVWTAVAGRVVHCDPAASAPEPLRGGGP
jgi:predicted amidohydrolase YtcJ